jgi:hypothetical protein
MDLKSLVEDGIGRNAKVEQLPPGQPDHLTPFIFKTVGWSTKIGEGWLA